MSQIAVYLSSMALLAGVIWLGVDVSSPLVRTLLRPLLLALLGTLVMVVAMAETMRWPYGLVSMATLLGLWESYGGIYGTLRTSLAGRRPVQAVQICTVWVVGVLANLTLLNMTFQLLYPSTFQWRGEVASLLDVAYLTLLTFASSGYGDVLPATAAGKVLSIITSLAGLLYATILFTALFQALRGED